MGLEARALPHTFDYALVALSVVIAIAASYAALDLAGRVTATRGRAQLLWLGGGATAMGFGIWSMHYVGMLAFNLPVPVQYDWPTVLASLAAAIFASGVALYVVSRRRMGPVQAVAGSVVMGAGIAGMHYTGMAAMRLAAACQFDPVLVAVSVVLAVVISLVALWLAFRVRDEAGSTLRQKLMSAVVMGLAIPVMHYTGMAACHWSASTAAPDLSHAVNGSFLGGAALTIVTIIVLGLAILTSVYDRRFTAQQAELQLAERRYRELFQRSPAGMIRVSESGRILDCNPAIARMFGYETPEELMATSMAERYFDVAERVALMSRLEQQRTMTDLERCLRRKDGSPVWLLTTVTVVGGENGEPRVFDGMMIDITDKKRYQVGLLHAQKLEAVGELAAGIAHEINTPVQFVSDNTRFLQDSFASIAEMVTACQAVVSQADGGPVGPDVLGHAREACERADWAYLQAEVPMALEQMQDGLGRVAKIVGAMKEFAHVDQSTEMSCADINRSLESTLVVARNEYKYVAQADTEFADLPPVMCHIGDLNQVFLNLVINAAHAIEDRVSGTHSLGRIGLRTRLDGDWVEISISDTGTGIAPQVSDKIFDPFFTTKTVGRGSGQGLALARAIVVDKHGGTLTFETEVGQGTTFHVRLPVNGKQASRSALAA